MKPTRAIDWLPLKSRVPLLTIGFVDGRRTRCSQEIRQLPAVVGRGDIPEVRIKDAWVSQIHCAFAYTDQGLIVRDLESRHGTRVNNRPVQAAALREGDVITIGAMTSIVILKIAEPATYREAGA